MDSRIINITQHHDFLHDPDHQDCGGGGEDDTRLLMPIYNVIKDEDAPPPLTDKEIEDQARAEKEAQQRRVR